MVCIYLQKGEEEKKSINLFGSTGCELESNHKGEEGLKSQRERGSGEKDVKRGWYKVDCSDNGAAASRETKASEKPT